MGLLRYFKNKLVSSGRRCRSVPFGIYRGLYLNIDLTTESQIYFGLWERETYRAITEQLTRADWMIDIGAGKGELSVLFASQPNIRKVVAVEPSNSECKILQNNIASNLRLIKVSPTIIQKSISISQGEQFISLDEITCNLNGTGFIKIDVDHFEIDVLASASRTLDKADMYWLVETHTRELEDACIKIFSDCGYTTAIINNAWWRRYLPEQRPSNHCRWLMAQSSRMAQIA